MAPSYGCSKNDQEAGSGAQSDKVTSKCWPRLWANICLSLCSPVAGPLLAVQGWPKNRVFEKCKH